MHENCNFVVLVNIFTLGWHTLLSWAADTLTYILIIENDQVCKLQRAFMNSCYVEIST